MRKFANFVRLYFPHITTFFEQILEFHYFWRVSKNFVFFVRICLDQNLVYNANCPSLAVASFSWDTGYIWLDPHGDFHADSLETFDMTVNVSSSETLFCFGTAKKFSCFPEFLILSIKLPLFSSRANTLPLLVVLSAAAERFRRRLSENPFASRKLSVSLSAEVMWESKILKSSSGMLPCRLLSRASLLSKTASFALKLRISSCEIKFWCK